MLRTITRTLGMALLLVSQPALSQVKPPDVPAYTTFTPSYAAGVTINTVNTTPSYTGELADIPTAQTGWTTANATTNTPSSFCTINGTTCPENKIRFHANYSHMLKDDPIRNYGQPGAAHLHVFVGNRRANAWSTFATLRNHPDSNNQGGRLNASSYWFPAFILTNPNADGKNYAVKPDTVAFYYNGADGAHYTEFSRFPMGLRNIFGTNMDDPENSRDKSFVTVANAQASTAGRYTYSGNGFAGYRCDTETGGTTTYFDRLKNSDGTDPFANTVKYPGGSGGCTGHIYALLDGPQFWDCTNLWSPGGYNHFSKEIFDNVKSDIVGPNGWCRLPRITLQVVYKANGFADYSRWRLSSDDMMKAKLDALPACSGGWTTACVQSTAAHTVLNGQSFHADYLLGWDKVTMREIFSNCIGTESGTPHQCDDSIMGLNKELLAGVAAPDGTLVQTPVNLSYGTTPTSMMVEVPASNTGPVTMHHSGL